MPLRIWIDICDRGTVEMDVAGNTELLIKQSACVSSKLNELIDQAELAVNPRPNILEQYLATRDPVVEQVIELMRKRSRVGKVKYGVGLDRTDLNEREWLQHLMEELADALGYAQRKLNGLVEAEHSDRDGGCDRA